jgi:MYXO-CTERM domain-containing protein
MGTCHSSAQDAGAQDGGAQDAGAQDAGPHDAGGDASSNSGGDGGESDASDASSNTGVGQTGGCAVGETHEPSGYGPLAALLALGACVGRRRLGSRGCARETRRR